MLRIVETADGGGWAGELRQCSPDFVQL